MSYTPTEWEIGDTITAAGLNKMEQGIASAGGAMVCILAFNSELNAVALDKTVQEIYDAYSSGTPVFVKYIYGTLGSDYTSQANLAPVVYIYGYDYTSTIRVCVSWAVGIGTKSSKNTLHSPAILNLSASSMSDYPQWYSLVSVPNANVQTD